MFEGLTSGLRRLLARPSPSDLEGTIAWQSQRDLTLADWRSLPAVNRARSFVVSQVAQLEPVAYRDGFPLDDQPAIVRRPQPGSTRDAFLGSIAGELFDHSNAFLWLPSTGRNADGSHSTAVVLPFDAVQVTWDETGLWRRYRWRGDELVAGRDLIHVELPGRRPDELLVPSKFDENADALSRVLAAELYAADWFENGAVPEVVLKYAQDLNGSEAEAAKATYLKNHRDRSPAVLGAGWDLSTTGGDPQTSQLLETRRAGVLEVARIWGIVPSDLLLAPAEGGSLTYQNIAGMLDTFYRVTGQPEYLSPIEAALSDLVPRTQVVRLNLAELFRLNEGERIQVETTAIAAGIYTLPEVRRAHGLPEASTPRVPAQLEPQSPAPEEVPVP